jgi:hypothetical protein
LRQKDYPAAATYFDRIALQEFRELMAFVNDIPAEKQKEFFAAFFGPGSSPESVSQLSDSDFFATFLAAILAQAEAVGELSFNAMEILGEVAEGSDVSHVVTRNKVSVGAIDMEAMEVVSARKDGDEWKLLLSTQMIGLATQLREAFSQQQQ